MQQIQVSRVPRSEICGLSKMWIFVLIDCRCRDESNHRELKKASGAFAVQFNEETQSLEVMVIISAYVFKNLLFVTPL